MKSLITSFLALLLLSCNQNSDKAPKAKYYETAAEEIMPAASVAEDAAAIANSDSETMHAAATSLSPKEEYQNMAPKIIKNGNLRFETGNIDTTYARIKSAVHKYKGIIQNDTEGKDYQSMFKNITVRVPNENFDAFIADISKGVSYFDNKEISSDDVTEEYIDIDARLKAKKVLEARYFELLKKAAKVSEMIEIEKQLSEIREEIEAKEGQLRYMQNRIAMSTVSISFYKTMARENGVTVSYGSKIWNAIKSGFNGISSFFIGLLEMWPFIAILVAVIYFIRKRFQKKRNKNEHPS